ncbi:hypothetical protein NMY22_g13821 [Coprinellus aureogranulatus]|nr:hypothetical protein NMY22_g13821 [Coprinellus aureogranulatus]
MSATFTPSLSRRPSSVYVQIPPSPFSLDHYQPLSSKHVNNAGGNDLKENTPLRAPRIHMLQSASTSSASSSLKRKLSDDDSSVTSLESSSSSTKKHKSASTGTPLKTTQLNIQPVQRLSNACEEFPNGSIYCHQCCKKRDVEATIQCTVLESKHMSKANVTKQSRCVAKYCKQCMQNRYQEDLDTLKKNRRKETGHVDNAGYYFTCPKCRDICNCPRCRKAKGLDPVGTMKPRGSQTSSAKETSSASKKKQGEKKSPKTQSAPPQPKKRAKKPKPKVLPAVKWTRVAPALSRDDVEERMHIREFALRFNYLSEAGLLKPQLEELEQINGKYSGNEGQDPSSWVSDVCVKAVVLMLLGILSKDPSSPYAEASQTAVRELRNGGFALTKVWATLEEWQESIASTYPDDEEPFAIEEPLPPSEHFFAQARRSTRTMASAASSNTVAIYSSSQLIPPILSLIDLTLELPSLREAIDEGAKDARDVTRMSREAIKLEAERWDGVRKEQERSKDKAAFQAAKRLHKDIVEALERSAEIAQCERMIRFAPLATDPDGHVFYALAPGHGEREAAFEYTDLLSNGAGKQKLKHKARALKPTEREDMHDWSWMIAVWGKKPPSAYCPVGDDDSDEDMDDDNIEGWWCFHDPSDIKELADWLVLAYDLGPDDADASPAMKQLVVSLKNFAELLEWRSREDKYQLPVAGSKGRTGK